jgi:UDP-glucose 4-epimerase
MRGFVTGGTGYIGTHVVATLLEAGDDVTVYARDVRTMPASLRARVAMVQGSLDDLAAVRDAARGHDACIHNAVVWRDDDPMGVDDVRASTTVFLAAAEAGVEQLVYTSSTAVHKPYATHMDETTRLAPTDAYGAAKASNELFLGAVSWQTKMRCNVVRPGPTVGGPSVDGARVVPYPLVQELFQRARRGDDLVVGKDEGRQFVAAPALAQVYVRLLRAGVNRQTYLAVAREVVTWEEIARMAVEATGSRSRVVVEARGGAPFVFDTGKLERELGPLSGARAAIAADLERCARAER